MDQDLKDHLETVFYDAEMIRPLVEQLRRDGDPELLQDLVYISTTRMYALSRDVVFDDHFQCFQKMQEQFW